MGRRASVISSKTKKEFARAVQDIKNATKKLKGQTGPMMYMIGEEIMTDIKDAGPGKGVPVDKGILRSTGKVTPPPRVTLSFGGPAAPYALIQHEATWFRHKIGEARYLVRGLQRWKPRNSKAFAVAQRNATKALTGGKKK